MDVFAVHLYVQMVILQWQRKYSLTYEADLFFKNDYSNICPPTCYSAMGPEHSSYQEVGLCPFSQICVVYDCLIMERISR